MLESVTIRHRPYGSVILFQYFFIYVFLHFYSGILVILLSVKNKENTSYILLPTGCLTGLCKGKNERRRGVSSVGLWARCARVGFCVLPVD